MADLTNLAEVKAFIGISDQDDHDAVLTQIMDAVETILESHTGQTFTSATTNITDEAHDGNGKDVMYLDRAPTALTAAVKIGQDSSDADTTIDTGDIIVDQANNRIIREGGLVFPRGRRNIFVSYTPAANVPHLAKMAVIQGTAYIYRTRGREHIKGASINEFGSLDMFGTSLAKQTFWQEAVAELRRGRVLV